MPLEQDYGQDRAANTAPPASVSHQGAGGNSGSGRSNIVFGLILTIVGVLFLLHNFDVFYVYDIWRYWPLLLIAAALSKVMWGRGPERMFGAVGVFIGAVFFVDNVFDVDVHLGQLWPVILVIVGIS